MKKFFTGTLVLALSFIAISTVFAAEDSFSPIVQRIAERFNLSEAEVQEVFTETREERMQLIKTCFEEKLDEAVEIGEVTEEQKSLILAKKSEMQEKHKELEGLSWEERGEAIKEFRQEIKEWKEENSIDLEGLGRGCGYFRNGRRSKPGGIGF